MKLRMKMIYRTPKGTEAEFLSDYLPPGAVLLLMEDMQQSARIHRTELIDQYDTEWTMKELRNYMKELETEPHQVRIYADGGFDKNTGKAGLGSVIFYEQDQKEYRIRRNQKMEQLISNNEAEYAALYHAIRILEETGVRDQEIEVLMDSLIVVNQMGSDWPVYEKELKYWADKVDDALRALGLSATYIHVDRKQNKEADQLASQALKDIEIDSTIQK
ncbi:reverse transcriptase-like protein [Terribacillus saccharophilus]|uniref:reverse transcriptase-like protein n=1 Tax=Terribacillus saccharophilus TaxID=361277 RepID=UPI0039823675